MCALLYASWYLMMFCLTYHRILLATICTRTALPGWHPIAVAVIYLELSGSVTVHLHRNTPQQRKIPFTTARPQNHWQRVTATDGWGGFEDW